MEHLNKDSKNIIESIVENNKLDSENLLFILSV